MAGRTGRRARPAGVCHKCGNRIADGEFLRDHNGDSHIVCPPVNTPGPEYEGCEQQCRGDNHAWNCRFSRGQLLRHDEEAMAALRLLKQKGYSVETICAAIASL